MDGTCPILTLYEGLWVQIEHFLDEIWSLRDLTQEVKPLE